MKQFTFIIVSALIAFSIHAQSGKDDVYQNGEGWNSIQVNYTFNHFGFNSDLIGNQELPGELLNGNFSNCTANGFSIGYARSFGLSKNSPIYLEAGITIQASFSSPEFNFEKSNHHEEYIPSKNKTGLYDYYIETNRSFKLKDGLFLSISVPVKFIYQVRLANNMAIEPFVGVYIRENILGQGNFEYSKKGVAGTCERDNNQWIYLEQHPVIKEKIVKDAFDIYETKTMSMLNEYVGDATDNRSYLHNGNDKKVKGFRPVQFGGMIGANVVFKNKYYLNASYGYDMIGNHATTYFFNGNDKTDYEIKSKRIGTLSVGCGIRF